MLLSEFETILLACGSPIRNVVDRIRAYSGHSSAAVVAGASGELAMKVVLAVPSTEHACLLRASPEQVAQQSVLGLKKQELSKLRCKEDKGRVAYGIDLHMAKQSRRNACAALDSRDKVSSVKPETKELPPPGCTRVKVELTKPLGIVLEEDRAGNIFVAEVFEGGNADKSGLVDVGDQLIATSGIVYGNEEYYQGVRVRKGMQIVRLSVFGEKFDTVMAAIGTHPAHVKVVLEIQKCPMPRTQTESNGADS